jgi:hypothetical protein
LSDSKTLRTLHALLRLAEGNMNRAKTEADWEHWKRRHQELVTKIIKLKKKESEAPD